MTQVLERRSELGPIEFALDLSAWNPVDHPRDSHGRFRDKWGLPDAAKKMIKRILAAAHPLTARDDGHFQEYADRQAVKKKRTPEQQASLDYMLTEKGWNDVQSTLRAGKDDLPHVRAFDGSKQQLTDDLLLTRVMGPDAFGLPPERIGEIEEWTGKLISDMGYTSTNLGTPYKTDGPHVTMSLLTPRGTQAVFPGGSREVILDRDQPIRIMKVEADGKGGVNVYGVVEPMRATGRGPARNLGAPLPAREHSPAKAATPEEMARRGLGPDGNPIPPATAAPAAAPAQVTPGPMKAVPEPVSAPGDQINTAKAQEAEARIAADKAAGRAPAREDVRRAATHRAVAAKEAPKRAAADKESEERNAKSISDHEARMARLGAKKTAPAAKKAAPEAARPEPKSPADERAERLTQRMEALKAKAAEREAPKTVRAEPDEFRDALAEAHEKAATHDLLKTKAKELDSPAARKLLGQYERGLMTDKEAREEIAHIERSEAPAKKGFDDKTPAPVAPSKAERPQVPELDAKVAQRAKARERQQEIASRTPIADVGAELDELVDKKATNEVMAEHVRAIAQGPKIEEIRDKMKRAEIAGSLETIARDLDKGRRAAALKKLATLDRKYHVQRQGKAGETVKFNPSEHESSGVVDIPEGASVRIVRPGAKVRHEDNSQTQLHKALVSTSTPAERVAKLPAPRKTTAKKAAPAAPAAPNERPDIPDVLDQHSAAQLRTLAQAHGIDTRDKNGKLIPVASLRRRLEAQRNALKGKADTVEIDQRNVRGLQPAERDVYEAQRAAGHSPLQAMKAVSASHAQRAEKPKIPDDLSRVKLTDVRDLAVGHKIKTKDDNGKHVPVATLRKQLAEIRDKDKPSVAPAKKAAVAKVSEPSALGAEAKKIMADAQGRQELDILLQGRNKKHLQGIAGHLGLSSDGTAAQLRQRISDHLGENAGTGEGHLKVSRLSDVLTKMSEPDVDLDPAHAKGAQAGWRDVRDASPGRSSTASAASQQALHDYKSDAHFREVNASLEAGEDGGEIADGVRTAMRPLDKDVVVYRGDQGMQRFLPKGTRATADTKGVEWTRDSFTSTSADGDAASHFATNDDGSVRGSQPTLMRIRVPKGTPAVAIDSTLKREGPDDISRYLDEQELLLGDGLTYRVTRDYGVVRGVRRLDVEVVPTKKVAKAPPAVPAKKPEIPGDLKTVKLADARRMAEAHGIKTKDDTGKFVPVATLREKLAEIRDKDKPSVAPAKKVAPVRIPKVVQTARAKASVKSRTEQPAGYPKRAPVHEGKESPAVPDPDYKPVSFTAPAVVDNEVTKKPEGWTDPSQYWADPADPREAMKSRPGGRFRSLTGPVQVDEQGRPVNPYTRTGIQDRGLLGKWGANQAEDFVGTRVDPETGRVQIMSIQRGEKVDGRHPWAVPGGMVDAKEGPGVARRRELLEETGVDLDMDRAKPVVSGYVDDPRNTDNAWMESAVSRMHLTPEEAAAAKFKGKDEGVRDKRWVDLDSDFVDNLYASHGDFVRQSIREMLDDKDVDLTPEQRSQLESALKKPAKKVAAAVKKAVPEAVPDRATVQRTGPQGLRVGDDIVGRSYERGKHVGNTSRKIARIERSATKRYEFYDEDGKLIDSINPNGKLNWRRGSGVAAPEAPAAKAAPAEKLPKLDTGQTGALTWLHNQDGDVRADSIRKPILERLLRDKLVTHEGDRVKLTELGRKAFTAAGPQLDADVVAERLTRVTSEKQALTHLEGLNLAQLRKVATAMNLPLPQRGTKENTDAETLRPHIARSIIFDRKRLAPEFRAPAEPVKATRAAAAPHQTREERVAELAARTDLQRQLMIGTQAETATETAPDGEKIVRKQFRDTPEAKHMVDAEVLGPKVVEAVGLRAPAAIPVDKRTVAMEHIEGKVGDTVVPYGQSVPKTLIDSEDGRLIGLADYLTDSTDRNPGNWIQQPNGRLATIDHADMFLDTKDPYTPPHVPWGLWGEFGDYLRGPDDADGNPTLAEHIDIPRGELAQLRQRLQALKPQFEERGRADWHKQVMRRMSELEARVDASQAVKKAEAKPTVTNLSKLSVAQLRAQMAERKIKVPPRATKADLVRILEGDGPAGQHHQDETPAIRSLAKFTTEGHEEVKYYSSGKVAQTALLQSGGRKVVRKRHQDGWNIPAEQQADAENLASRVGQAVTASVPAVYQRDARTVYMDHAEGKLAHDITTDAELRKLASSAQGKRIAILDAIIGNQDRHTGNWLVTDEGHITGIDHGTAWFREKPANPKDPFAPLRPDEIDYFSRLTTSRGKWRDKIEFSRAELDRIRTRLVKLRPEFALKGRLDWYDEALGRLDEIIKRASLP